MEIIADTICSNKNVDTHMHANTIIFAYKNEQLLADMPY